MKSTMSSTNVSVCKTAQTTNVLQLNGVPHVVVAAEQNRMLRRWWGWLLCRYYTSDASFNHPLCSVGAAPGSREGLLRVYQYVRREACLRASGIILTGLFDLDRWYRILSPKLSLQVHERSWVEHTGNAQDPTLSPTPKGIVRRGSLFLEITQTFHLFFSPLSARPARLIVKLSLVKEGAGSLWFIERQEDWYQPEVRLAAVRMMRRA